VDEAAYFWHKIRGKDPREHFSKVGHTATEARKVEAEQEGNQEFWALKDVSFDVQPGEVIGVIGRNGAGKSTLLKILTRITEPTSGEAFINGRVASLLEVGTGFHPELTGRENVYMNGTILGMKKREIDAKFDEIVAFSELEKFIDTPVKRYSSGMYVRLAFAVAAHLDPEILLVDEVLAVGDASFQKKCLGKMGDVAKEGRTILFVSHNMAAVENLCSQSLYLQNGQIQVKGKTAIVLDQYLRQNQGIAKSELLQYRKDREGSGRAKVTDFFITDLNGTRQETIQPGRDYRFCIKCQIDQFEKNLGNIVASIALSDRRNQMVWLVRTSFTNDNQTFDHPAMLVECTVNNFSITEGLYYATVFLSKGETEILDLVTDAAEIVVEGGDYFGTGSKGLPSHCSVLTRCSWKSTEC